jgi:glycosyltransferase involved in cell wall biosynthesis
MTDFSIIIPAYNNLSLFVQAYSSVIEQRDVKFEIIVVDDSTTDDIANFIGLQNDIRIFYIHNQPSLGAVKNWNFGLQNARGRFLILLHHDEYFEDKYYYLRKCLSIFNDTDFEIIVSNVNVRFVNNISRKLSFPFFLRNLILKKVPSFLYILNIVGPVSCVTFKRDLLHSFDERLSWIVDIDWYYRLFVNKKVFCNNELFVCSNHGHEGQITQNININDIRRHDLEIIFSKTNFFSSIILSLLISNIIYKLKSMPLLRKIKLWKINPMS